MNAGMNESKNTGMGRLAVVVALPAYLMDRLRYAYKFILIGVLFLVPLAVVAWLQSSNATEQVDFNQKEITGIVYLEPARQLLTAIERARINSAAVLSGDSTRTRNRSESIETTDRRVADVDAVDAKLGGVLKTTERWQAVKKAWTDAKTAGGSAEAVDGKYAEAAAATVDLILNYIGNNSNLILDPDLDSYWLMDSVIVKIPALEDSLAKEIAMAIRPAGDAASQLERRMELAGLNKITSSTMSDLDTVDLTTSFKEVANFSKDRTVQPAIQGPAENAKLQVGSTTDRIRTVYVVAGDSKLPMAEHSKTIDVGLDAIAKLDALGAAINPKLTDLAQARVDRYKGRRTSGILAAVFAAAFLVFLFGGFYVSVRRSVVELGSATQRMIKGTNETFELPAKDELGDVARAYNDINIALLEARRLKDQVQAENAQTQEDIMGLLEAVSEASDGNLAIRATVSAGSLGNVSDAFNQLMESLGTLIQQVQKQIEQTNQSIDSITNASRNMQAGATSQANEVESATAVVNSIKGETEKVSAGALTASEATARTESSALEGSEAVQNVISGMGVLRANVQAGAKKVKALGDRSMEITGIVNTISRISEQTNMLALNAAIEAARAGEYGRGFSVVAEEVRKLAERTAAATQEIDVLVKAIQVETSETVQAIEHQTQVVEQQSVLVGKCGEALERIRGVSAESARIVVNISEVAKRQVESTSRVVLTVGEISAIAKQTAAGAQSTVTAAGQLNELSSRLTESVRRFKVA